MAPRPLDGLKDGAPPDVTCGYQLTVPISASFCRQLEADPRGAVDKALKNVRLQQRRLLRITHSSPILSGH
jgi:hypothetical protein